MASKKVKLAWTANASARKASLKKRRAEFLKKMSEVTTLCGVKGCAIIYGPDDSDRPVVWPSKTVVQQLMRRFWSVPKMIGFEKMVDQESYQKERVLKMQEQSKKYLKKNMEFEFSYLMEKLHYQGNGIDDFETTDMQVLICLLEEKIKYIRKIVDCVQQANAAPDQYDQDDMLWDQWFDFFSNRSNEYLLSPGSGRAIGLKHRLLLMELEIAMLEMM